MNWDVVAARLRLLFAKNPVAKSAFATQIVHTLLRDLGRLELLPYIISVQWSETEIILTTHNSLINQELIFLRDPILQGFRAYHTGTSLSLLLR